MSSSIIALPEYKYYLDPERKGFFSILSGVADKKKVQRSHKLEHLDLVMSGIQPHRDTWVSQAEFFLPNRRAVNFKRVGLCFCDIDTYTKNIDTSTLAKAESVAQMVIQHCKENSIPVPSIAVYSGRGLQVKWLLEETVTKDDLPRWNAVQTVIQEKLAHFGADPAAKDISRVLRLEGTVNTKSGEEVRIIHVEQVDGQPKRYGFDYLCEWLLSADYFAERERQIQAAQARRERRPSLRLVSNNGDVQKRTGNFKSVAWWRLNDLRKLVDMRGGVHEKTTMLHWQLNFLALAGAVHTSNFWDEANELAEQIAPGWNYVDDNFSTLRNKLEQYLNGDPALYNGKEYPALYTPKNEKLIEIFEITPEEQRQLKTIKGREVTQERDRERQAAKRLAKGATPRELSNARLKPWEALGMGRSKWYALGKPTADLVVSRHA